MTSLGEVIASSTGALSSHSPSPRLGCRVACRARPGAVTQRALLATRPGADGRRAGIDRVAGGTPQPARAGRLHPRPVGLPRPGSGGRSPCADSPARDRGAGGCVPGVLDDGAGAGGAGCGHRIGRDCAGNCAGAAVGAGDGHRHFARRTGSRSGQRRRSRLGGRVAGVRPAGGGGWAAIRSDRLQPALHLRCRAGHARARGAAVGAAHRDHFRAGRTGAAAGAGASRRRPRSPRAGCSRWSAAPARPGPWPRRWPPAGTPTSACERTSPGSSDS